MLTNMKQGRGSAGPAVGRVLMPWLLGLYACVPAPFGASDDDKLQDGARCNQDAECKSGTCSRHSRLCSHSFCDCPGDTCTNGGEPSPDCAEGWLCVYYETVLGDIGEVFNIARDTDGGYCRPTCAAGCPEHYICKDGQFCSVDSNWADPVPHVEWSGGASGSDSGRNRMIETPLERGQSVELRARAESPLGLPVETFEWTIGYGSRTEMLSGAEVGLQLDETSSYVSAQLVVRDPDYRSALFSIVFMGCTGAGGACGYQGSGCCNGCDMGAGVCR